MTIRMYEPLNPDSMDIDTTPKNRPPATPRTDAVTFEVGSPKAGQLGFQYVVVDAMFARQLERENARLVKALSMLAAEAYACAEMARPSIGNTNANCLLTRAEEARELLRELGESA